MKEVITTGEVMLRQRIGARSGLFTENEVKHLNEVGIESGAYYSKKESGGILMSKMEDQTLEMERAEKALTSAIHKFVESAKSSEKNIKQTSGKIRDSVDKLAGAIQKLMSIANSSDFGKTVEQAESLVSALERLADLENSGKLDRIMDAMKQR